ncbi:nucleotide exchange factor sil1 [Coemansia sp. RSA 2703]|nr:nucleotide exchange factor sil1 [Coemansia sp. RSA 2703]KAJ1859819.1 nucleotide exchange factor sil1 [Coemansia sp. RSA 2703]KAJ2375809.1 nucleotide exchange factor sil1 [Coemansia sp. RSA 2607]KAJ2396419.1 nucleotide exchange factor sil1 [Coemansia sp. RSA 2603]
MVSLSAVSLLALAALLPLAQTAEQHVFETVDNTTICSTDSTGEQTCYPRLFVATNDFQLIRPGQDIPPGLHVQIDMQTGQRMARLMPADNEVNQENAVALVSDTSVEAEENKDTRPPSYPHSEQLHEYIDRLAQAAKAPVDPAETSTQQILGELEDLVHETRHAHQLLHDARALPALLRLADPSSAHPAAVRRLAAVVLGAAVQNNPRLQATAHSAGSVPALLRALAAEHDPRTAGKLVFALSALVRGHAAALAQFAELGGLRVLAEINPLAVAVGDDNEYEAHRLDVRIVRFVEDLFNPELTPEVQRDQASLLAQSAAVWCDTLATRLVDALGDVESEGLVTLPTYARRSAYAQALQSLKAAYPATCALPQDFTQWVQDEIARVPKTGDEAAEEYRLALTELAY